MPRGIPKSATVMDQLAKASYHATDEQIETLARLNYQNIQGLDAVRGVYLKALVDGVQRAAKPGKRAGSYIVELLDQVHDRFYTAVLKGVVTKDTMDDPTAPQEERTARSLERNRRSAFARTAKNAVGNFLKAGGDLFTLDAAKVTKTELVAFASSMRSRVNQQPGQKVKLASERLEESLRELADNDKDAGIQTLQEAMARLANLLAELGVESTTRTMVAVRDHKMLRLPEGTFWPMGRAVANRGASAVQ